MRQLFFYDPEGERNRAWGDNKPGCTLQGNDRKKHGQVQAPGGLQAPGMSAAIVVRAKHAISIATDPASFEARSMRL